MTPEAIKKALENTYRGPEWVKQHQESGCQFVPQVLFTGNDHIPNPPFSGRFKCSCEEVIFVKYSERMLQWTTLLMRMREYAYGQEDEKETKEALEYLLRKCMRTTEEPFDFKRFPLMTGGLVQCTMGWNENAGVVKRYHRNPPPPTETKTASESQVIESTVVAGVASAPNDVNEKQQKVGGKEECKTDGTFCERHLKTHTPTVRPAGEKTNEEV